MSKKQWSGYYTARLEQLNVSLAKQEKDIAKIMKRQKPGVEMHKKNKAKLDTCTAAKEALLAEIDQVCEYFLLL